MTALQNRTDQFYYLIDKDQASVMTRSISGKPSNSTKFKPFAANSAVINTYDGQLINLDDGLQKYVVVFSNSRRFTTHNRSRFPSKI